jgi:lauroyl/myristoyl acyltransferase
MNSKQQYEASAFRWSFLLPRYWGIWIAIIILDDICFTPLVYTMSIGENFIKPVMEISTFQKKNYSQKPFYMFS